MSGQQGALARICDRPEYEAAAENGLLFEWAISLGAHGCSALVSALGAVRFWVELKVWVKTHKSLTGLGPAYLRDGSSPHVVLPQRQTVGIPEMHPPYYKR